MGVKTSRSKMARPDRFDAQEEGTFRLPEETIWLSRFRSPKSGQIPTHDTYQKQKYARSTVYSNNLIFVLDIQLKRN